MWSSLEMVDDMKNKIISFGFLYFFRIKHIVTVGEDEANSILLIINYCYKH